MMLRLVLALFLAGVSAELANTELAEYGERLLNDCTRCNLVQAMLTMPVVMDEIQNISPEFAKYLSNSQSQDCTSLCTNQVQACNALSVLSEDILGPVHDMVGDDAMTEIMNVMAMFIDPADSCGFRDPTMPITQTKQTRGQRLSITAAATCVACRIGMKLIHYTVVGGKSSTSKKIIAATGKGLTNLCIKIKIPELLSKVSWLLGQVDVCGAMPKVAEKLFEKVLAPIFTAPIAGKICGKISPGCSII
ncbi:unnamed protein product [Cylicocyclus nassatus]|uniref:Uncharacterized protein n=1 Tax=Cylicocyclus nassatus TaxID=53992 RepID=A0AA36GM57_CYLNA|nr:unnamed protein product [Cylicocyclus nassatus]